MEQLEVILDQFEFDVDFIERELVEVSITSIDIVHRNGVVGATTLAELTDVDLSSPITGQYLKYNASTGKWENASLGDVLLQKAVYNELPTKISSKIFELANDFVSGSVRVFLNGLKEIYVSETGNNRIIFDSDTAVGDVIEVNYIKQ